MDFFDVVFMIVSLGFMVFMAWFMIGYPCYLAWQERGKLLDWIETKINGW